MNIAPSIPGLLCTLLLSSLALPAAWADFVSTGANGALIVLDNTSLDPGRFDFTDVFIDTNAALSFNPSPGTLNIFLLAQGSVTINGGLYAPGANLYVSTPALLTINGPIRSGNVYLSAGSIYSSESGSVYGSGSITLAGGIDATGTVGSIPGACSRGAATVLIGGPGAQVPSGSCAIITAGGSLPVSGGSVSITPTPLPGSAVLFLAGLPLLALFLRRPAPLHGNGSDKGLAYQSA